jgi:hypothetical protein
VPCGGLLGALPPEIATKHLDAATRAIWIQCRGFNDKNFYPRKTPGDDDTLRKAVKDVSWERWQEWFNGPVQQPFQEYGFFDPRAIFLADATYLFVPDNPDYEGSVVMWFDEHNHPVDYERLDPQERKKAHRERCYKLVSAATDPATGCGTAAAHCPPGGQAAGEIGAAAPSPRSGRGAHRPRI